MYKAGIIIIYIFLSSITYSQIIKNPLDLQCFTEWPRIEARSASISADGKFAFYVISNQPYKSNTLMIHSLDGKFKRSYVAAKNATFFNNRLIFLLPNDTLCIFDLEYQTSSYIRSVKTFDLINGSQSIVTTMSEREKNVTLINLLTDQRVVFTNVDKYYIAENGNALIIKRSSGTENSVHISKFDIAKSLEFEIWQGDAVSDLVLNKSATQLAFVVGSDSTKAIFYYKEGFGQPKEIARFLSKLNNVELELNTLNGFNNSGDKLYITATEPSIKLPAYNIKLNIWHYTDAKLQSQQLKLKQEYRRSLLHVILLNESFKMLRIQNRNEELSISTFSRSDKHFLLTSVRGTTSEYYWNKSVEPINYLVTADGKQRKQLKIYSPRLSPNDKFVIGYSSWDEYKDWSSFDIEKNTLKCITQDIHVQSNRDIPQKGKSLDPVAWLKDNSAILFYDDYDIWVVDPTGEIKSKRLTHGREDHVRYRLINESFGFTRNDTIVLKAFNNITKESGFCHLILNKGLTKVKWRKAVLYDGITNVFDAFDPIKAKASGVHLVSMQTTTMSPNIYWTRDFGQYFRISDVGPEKEYNWMTSELVIFKTEEGDHTKAILYKPENFDSSKKYPLIIHYYDKRSDELNSYRRPLVSGGGGLDIPWFVSHGYLVLVTDVNYKIGKTGESAKNCVEGAAVFISKRNYVDKNRIGLYGHSFGGWITNYLLTHSKLFAAAMSSSGVSNLVSNYLSIGPTGSSKHDYIEIYGYRMGISSPWENPESYIKNSPIYYVGNVSAPILIMANKNDRNVPFEQGQGFFTGLRRAGKRAWMLEYDNGGHGLHDVEDYKDCIIRMTQFFDHYLKDSACPRWMMYGIPAEDKGVIDGFDLIKEKDPKTGRWLTPKEGELLKEEEKKKVDALKKKRPVTITLN